MLFTEMLGPLFPQSKKYNLAHVCNSKLQKDMSPPLVSKEERSTTFIDPLGKITRGLWSVLTSWGKGRSRFLSLLLCLLNVKCMTSHWRKIIT